MGSSSASCQLGPSGHQLKACKLVVLPQSLAVLVCWVSPPLWSVSHAGADACRQPHCFKPVSSALWAPAPRPPACAGAVGRAAARTRGPGSCTTESLGRRFSQGCFGYCASQPAGPCGLPSWCGGMGGSLVLPGSKAPPARAGYDEEVSLCVSEGGAGTPSELPAGALESAAASVRAGSCCSAWGRALPPGSWWQARGCVRAR